LLPQVYHRVYLQSAKIPKRLANSNNNITKRSNEQRRLRIKKADRVILAIIISIFHIKDKLSIVRPESVLRWQRELIKSFWTFKPKKRPGRPAISHEIRQLILSMKNDNLYWGNRKIQGELLKLGIK